MGGLLETLGLSKDAIAARLSCIGGSGAGDPHCGVAGMTWDRIMGVLLVFCDAAAFFNQAATDALIGSWRGIWFAIADVIVGLLIAGSVYRDRVR